MNKFLKLPFSFDANLLKDDLNSCLNQYWTDHFNTKDYDGKWTSIALRSLSGNSNDINAHTGIYKNTPLLEQCPHFQTVIGMFNCELEAVRLLCLSPGSTIREHTDPGCSYQAGFFRIHIPLQTDEHVAFKVAGEDLIMNPGECWYANFELPHSVHNAGTADRIHLILDGKRNDWSDTLFEEAGYDFLYEAECRQTDRDTMLKVINELSLMGTETGNKLIEQLKKKL